VGTGRPSRAKNKRALPRIDLEVAVAAASDHGRHEGDTVNISAGGVFIATAALVPVGERLMLELTLPGGDGPIALDSRVRWLRRKRSAGRRDRPAGMGVQFINLTTETSSIIGSFLQQHLSPFAGPGRGGRG
jgi:uncharacterized protein (TIGR02266 family)